MASEPSTFWTLDVELAPDAEELWSLFCYERGASGAQWLEEQPERVRMRYTFDALDPAEAADWPAVFAAQFPDVPAPREVVCERHAVEPWATQWREHFRPLPVGERLLICPPWDRAEADPAWQGRKRVVIDPGQGFGTGQHASTYLALGLIEEVAAERRLMAVLDVGTGSGILAAAACLLGAGKANCVDIDDRVVPEVHNNFALSGIAVTPVLAIGGPEVAQGPAPLVLANLMAPLLIEIAPRLVALTLPGGDLILSGILTAEHADVETCYRALGMTTAAVRHRESWTGLRMHNPQR